MVVSQCCFGVCHEPHYTALNQLLSCMKKIPLPNRPTNGRDQQQMNLLAQSQRGGSHSKDRQHEKSLGISGLQDFGWFILSTSVVNIAEWDKKLWCIPRKRSLQQDKGVKS